MSDEVLIFISDINLVSMAGIKTSFPQNHKV